MWIETVTRTVRTFSALERLFGRIERGDQARPDWIRLKGEADLKRVGEAGRAELLGRLHATTLRGFQAPDVRVGGRRAALGFWLSLARAGFHDFAADKWSKGYATPFVENYDYLTPYVQSGLAGLDPFRVYSSVLGTWEYSVEDFKNTHLLSDLGTVVEPLAGSAEFSHAGHFRYPHLSYCMFDLDEQARRYVDAMPWLPDTRRTYLVADALSESTWKQVRAFARGTSLSYIGKQSHNFFDVHQLLQILDWGTRYTDHLMLEMSEPYLLDEEPTIDDLTRPEQRAVGLRVALEDDDDRPSNPLTGAMHFCLVAWDEADRRELFSYRDWTGWQAPMLTALARSLGLEVRYFHDQETEFLSVEEGTGTADCRHNNTFMLFSRR